MTSIVEEETYSNIEYKKIEKKIRKESILILRKLGVGTFGAFFGLPGKKMSKEKVIGKLREVHPSYDENALEDKLETLCNEPTNAPLWGPFFGGIYQVKHDSKEGSYQFIAR